MYERRTVILMMWETVKPGSAIPFPVKPEYPNELPEPPVPTGNHQVSALANAAFEREVKMYQLKLAKH